MPRLDGLPHSKRSWSTRFLLRAIERQVGRLVDTWPIAAHVPQLARGWAAMEWFLGRARFNRPFEIGAAGFSEGAFCPLPERPTSAGGEPAGGDPS